MMRVPIWATAFTLVGGGSLAAPALEAPVQAPRIERTTPSEDWSPQELVLPLEEALAAEGVEVARKGRGGGGHRGGARGRNRGGFRAGNARHAGRHGGGVHSSRSVNVDVDDDHDALGAALVGGVVGLGVGAMINDQQDDY